MKVPALLAIAALSMLLPNSHAQSRNDAGVLRLLTCQDAWMDWSDDPVKLEKIGTALRLHYAQSDRDSSFVPNKPMSVLGHRVVQLYPQSFGLGVGYSVIVSASFDNAKASIEKQTDKPFDLCDSASDGKACTRQISTRKILMVHDNGSANATTLIGCYYLFVK